MAQCRSDIAKCPGELDGEICPLRDECRRYLVSATDWQTWMLPVTFGEGCEMFWPVDHETRKEPTQ
jgi:hypothetical protein